jgi:hypothetical protein
MSNIYQGNNIDLIERRSLHDPVGRLEEDLLNRRDLAELILSRLQAEDCPSAIGLYGNWGTGKTSVLNFIQQLNFENRTSHKRLILILVDAWLYEGTGNLFIPIVSKLKGFVKSEAQSKIEEYSKRVLMVSSLVLLNMGVSRLGIDVDSIKQYYDDSSDDRVGGSFQKINNEIQQTRLAFQKLIDAVLEDESNDCRLVICVDNLDRCSPDSVVHLLGSIKNFVDVGKCTWLFSMDADIVARYLDARYSNIEMYGNNYLDKIIPEQYHLSLSPTKNYREIRSLLGSVMQSDDGVIPLQHGKIPEIPRLIVPRRLIKSALKYKEYREKGVLAGCSPHKIFSLILLYYGWPEFYEVLSFRSEIAEIILAQFTNSDKIEGDVDFPLSKRFVDDQNLAYFLRRVLASDDGPSFSWGINEIIAGISELRRVGLP